MDSSRLLALPLAAAALASCAQKEQEKSQPNILFIMTDDHTTQAMSCYGGRLIETPNMDRLAREGMRFENCYATNALSGPSRACILTGKFSHENGFTDNASRFNGDQQTFPKLLQSAGYETAMIGKWHLISEPQGFDFWSVLSGQEEQGDYYNPVFINNGERECVLGYSTNIVTDKAIEWLENGRDKDKPFCLFLHHKAPHRSWMPDLQDLDLYNDVTYPLPETFYDDYEGRVAAGLQEMSIIKDMNIVYDLKMADPENEIHTPENPTLERYGRDLYLQTGEFRQGRMTPEQQAVWDAHYGPIIEKFKRDSLSGDVLSEWKYQRYMRDYCRVIHSVDRNVGRVYDYLKEHGLLENTLVIYTSDQGFFMGEHGWFDKRFMYEESFRTPLLVRLPDCMNGPRGCDIDGFVQNIDHAATFLELAGAPIPDDIQGESYLPMLKSGKAAGRKSLYYHYYEYPAEHAVRRHYGVRTSRYSLMHFYNDIDEWELYDLKKDPQQMHNIYGQPGTERLTKRLIKELHRLQDFYDDPIETTLH